MSMTLSRSIHLETLYRRLQARDSFSDIIVYRGNAPYILARHKTGIINKFEFNRKKVLIRVSKLVS